MKTGLESLDTGAPEITYSGNQGPKSPQEDQQKMAEFELQEYMEEFERVFPDMKNKRGTPDYMKELQDYFEGLASKQSEGIGDMAMKSGLIDEYRNYKMGQEEAGEQFMSPRDYYRSLEQDRMGAAFGGIMGVDGRRAYVGGSYSGKDPKGGNQGAGQHQGNVGGASNRGDGGNNRPTMADIANVPSQNTVQAPYEMVGGQKFAVGDPRIAEARNTFVPTTRAETPKSNLNLVDLYKKYSPLANFAKMFGPLDNKEFFIEKVLTSRNPQGYTEDDYDDYITARMAGTIDAYGNPIGGREGGENNPYILPQYATTGMTADATGEDVDIADTDTEDFASRFAPVTSLPFADYKGGIEVSAADGGRIGYAGGGITDLRQGYFLGKLVKKATRAVKKIAKSPIGKAALLYGIGAMGGSYGLGKGLFSKGMFNPMNMKAGLFGANSLMMNKLGMGEMAAKKGLLNKLGLTKGYGSFMPTAFGGISALSTLPLFMGQEEEDNLDDATGQAARGPSIQDVFGMNLNQIAKGAREGTLDPNIFNFLQSAADGGRIGLAAGGIGDLRGALSKEMFNLGEEDEDKIKELALGGSAGLPPVTMMSEGTNSMSFPDDESTGIAQATPTTTLPNQMPRPRPMMDPRMMQQMMMAQRGMMQQPRIMAQEGGRIGYADAGSVRKDPDEVVAGMNNELNPGFFDKLPLIGGYEGKYPVDADQGASLIGEIQDYKYGESYPGETIGVKEKGIFNVIPKPDRPPMSMEKTIKALEDRWDIAIEEGYEPGKGGEFDDLGIYSKEDIRRRVELGYDQAKGPEIKTRIMKAAKGGRIGAQEGGMMDMGGMEKDYRNEGGFVPIGGQERADDVPARLSKNEFVFTADAVRNAGGGDIDKGAEIMENMMENLEAGGKVSKGSQGLSGAREMFATQQRLGEVL